MVQQKGKMNCFIPTISISSTRVKTSMANIAYSTPRYVWYHRKTPPA